MRCLLSLAAVLLVTLPLARTAHAVSGSVLPATLEGALSKGWGWGYLFVFIGGMVTCFTPCVYPLIAITVGIFAGVKQTSRLKSAGLTALYTLGLAVTMSVLGLFAGLAGGQGLGAHLSKPYVVIPLTVLFFGLALSMFGAFELRLPATLNDRLNRIGGAGPLGAFLMGLVGGLIALPCTGPVLAGILAFVGVQGNPVLGFTLLFTYAVGFGLMFWVVATFSAWLPKSGVWMEGVKSFFGVVLCVVALYFLEFLLPSVRKLGTAKLWFLLTSIGVLLAGIAAGGLHLTFKKKKKLNNARKAIGLVLMVVGATGMVHYFISPPTRLKHRSDLKQAVAEAQQKKKPVIIDFWAVHCLPCIKMDKETFAHPKVAKLVREKFEFVKIDCSKDTKKVRRLRKRYKAIQLPTLIILDRRGRIAKRLHGFVGPQKLLSHLKKIE